MSEGGEVSARIGVQVVTQDTALEDLRRRFNALKEELRELKQASKDAGSELGEGFKKGTAEADTFKAMMGTVASSIGLVTDAIRTMNQAREAAAASLLDAGGLGSLAQLAGGDAKLNAELQMQAFGFSNLTGMDIKASERAIFDLQSASVNTPENREFYGKLSLVEPNLVPMIQGAAKLRANLGEGVGSDRQIASKAFAASNFVEASASQVLGATAKSAFFGSELSLSDEELIAATSIIGQKAPIDQAGTQLAALLKVLNAKGFGQTMGGQGLAAMLASIDSMGLEGKALNDYFGDVEAIRGFGALSGADLDQRVAVIEAANTQDLGARSAEAHLATPIGASTYAARVTAQRAANAQLQKGIERNAANAVTQSMKTKILAGEDPMGNLFSPELDHYFIFDAKVPEEVPVIGGFPLSMHAMRRAAGTLAGESDAEYARRMVRFARESDRSTLEPMIQGIQASKAPVQRAPVYNITNNVTNLYGSPEPSDGGIN